MASAVAKRKNGLPSQAVRQLHDVLHLAEAGIGPAGGLGKLEESFGSGWTDLSAAIDLAHLPPLSPQTPVRQRVRAE